MTFAERVYWLVRRIPPGRVMTYGEIALASGAPRAARVVGGALRHCPDPEGVPWQRVVNAGGGISPRHPEHRVHEQAKLLRQEGVEIEQDGPLYVLDLRALCLVAGPGAPDGTGKALRVIGAAPSPTNRLFIHRRPPRRRRW